MPSLWGYFYHFVFSCTLFNTLIRLAMKLAMPVQIIWFRMSLHCCYNLVLFQPTPPTIISALSFPQEKDFVYRFTHVLKTAWVLVSPSDWFSAYPSKYSSLSFCQSIFETGGPGSWVGIATEYGLDGPGSNPGGDEILPPVQTGPGAHPASCEMGTGSFPGVKCGRGVLLTTHPLLVPRCRKSRAIPLPTPWAT